MQSLKVGLQVNTAQREWTWREIRDLAMHAEAVGLDSIWTEDHLLGDYDGRLRGTWECWSVLAGLATTTEHVTLGPIVSCAAFRNPGLLANVVTTLDEMSGGRIVLGLGAGSEPEDFARFGWSWEDRATIFDETLRAVVELLRTGRSDLAGRHVALHDARLVPYHERHRRIPIMVGAFRPWMLRRAVEHADVWNTFWSVFDNRPEVYARHNAEVDDLCDAVGRAPEDLRRSAVVYVEREDPLGLPLRLPDRIQPLRGPVDALAGELAAFAEAGADELQLLVDPPTPAAVSDVGRALELLRR